jgi:glyoxylase-like metal-dependent hydrolase (beta-lactamase superfamily II)
MREIASGVYLEKKYPGVQVAAIVGKSGLMLIDCPLRVEDGREWLAQLAKFGKAKYLVLLDHHPDRVLGSRSLDVPGLSHDRTRATIAAWTDTFKGSTRPIGGESDSLKRITGVTKAVPQISFSDETLIYLGNRIVRLWHMPGPMAGAIWLMLSDAKVVFIGDAVTKSEPPYFGEANLEAWLRALDELRSPAFKGFRLVSARDGFVDRNAINAMGRFLRRIPPALKRLAAKGGSPEDAAKIGAKLISSHRVTSARKEQVIQRMQASLIELHARMHLSET